jgi:UPF0755 protein
MTLEQKSRAMTFPRLGKFIIIFFAIAFIIVGARAYQLYRYVFHENVKYNYVLLITEQDSYKTVNERIKKDSVLINYKAFTWVAKKKSYPENVKTGLYELKKGMNTNEVLNMLRSGAQVPVDVTFNNVRFKEDLAGKVSQYIQADSVTLLQLFSKQEQIKEWGFTVENFRTMFIPNTYEMYWTTSAEDFAERMYIEYQRFWNEERKAKAKAINLSPQEVATLASIVQSETAKSTEYQRIAGLYINRINRGILLQADPTVKYAIGNFSVKRVLNKHLEVESPYNTYKFVGLPPGPICFPDIATIDAVLNYEEHNFLYMCAREDFSGYHNFASTLSQHNINAERYRQALNERKIYR